ncbi:MAG: tetratricopeptide repeat protein, partial [Opitutus sp.]
MVLLVLDCWPLGRFTPVARSEWWRVHRCVVLEKLPFFALAGLIAVVTVLMQRHVGAFTLNLPLDARLGNAVVALVRYLGMFFWPSALSVCYQHPGYWPGLTVAGALVLLAGISLAAWHWRKTHAWIIIGWLWFIVMLLPAIGILQVGFQALADRYTYLPILGWQFALCWSLRTLRLDKVMMGLGVAVSLGACLVSTWRQQGYWRDSLVLFQHAVELDEPNGYAHGFLGYTYFNLGDLAAAARHSDRSIQLDPTNKVALYTLACVEDRLGHYDQAAVYLKAILDQHADYLSARYLYSIILLRLGHRAEAFSELNKVASQSPAIVRTNLEQAFAQESRPDIALPFFEMAVTLEPKDYIAQFGYGMTLEKLGRHEEALARFEETLHLKPDHYAARLQSGILLVNRNRPAEAVPLFRSVLASHPEDSYALAGLGRAAEKLGQPGEATRYFARARQLAPNDAGIQRAWAEILMRRGQYVEAAEAFTQLLSLRP